DECVECFHSLAGLLRFFPSDFERILSLPATFLRFGLQYLLLSRTSIANEFFVMAAAPLRAADAAHDRARQPVAKAQEARRDPVEDFRLRAARQSGQLRAVQVAGQAN